MCPGGRSPPTATGAACMCWVGETEQRLFASASSADFKGTAPTKPRASAIIFPVMGCRYSLGITSAPVSARDLVFYSPAGDRPRAGRTGHWTRSRSHGRRRSAQPGLTAGIRPYGRRTHGRTDGHVVVTTLPASSAEQVVWCSSAALHEP